MPDQSEKIRRCRAAIDGYAPRPAEGEVSPVALARHLAVQALVRWVRLDCTPVSATGMHARYTEIDAMSADIAGAVALWALAALGKPEVNPPVSRGWPLVPGVIADKPPSIIATMIRDIWDSEQPGEWLRELLGGDVTEDVSALVVQLCGLTKHAELAELPKADLRTVLADAHRAGPSDPEAFNRAATAAGLLPATAAEAVTGK